MSYVELHARSAFSFLRGASTPEKLAEQAAALGLPAVALCDRNGVYGAPRLFGKAKEFGIKAIVGAELTMEDQTVLPVLVESQTGYQNLCQLLTRAHLRSEKGKARVGWEELPEFAKGLVALTGDEEGPLVRSFAQSNFKATLTPALSHPMGEGEVDPALGRVRSHQTDSSGGNAVLRSLSGKLNQRLNQSDTIQSRSMRDQCVSRPQRGGEGAGAVIEKLLGIFGPEHLFVELQRHHLRGEERNVRDLMELAEQFRLPLLATNGVLYSTELQRPILDVFTCIRNHTHLDAAGKLLAQNSERYLKTATQMTELFRDCPEAIENTGRLAERLDFTLENLGYEFPAYPVPAGHTMDSFLREQALAGAWNRYRHLGEVPRKVRQQIETELALIAKLKVAGYFLIVWDIVQFCREQNIMAQGRGSAANSTVCFCLGITAVDPVRFETLFERFLTEGRKHSWPDIDIDLPSGARRERVIQEIYKRYGKHGAAMTANVISFRGRSAAREVGKALNLSGDVLNRFSNLYANGDFPHTLGLTSQMEKAGLPKEHPRAAAFAVMCDALGGLPRHLGQHSGGMIICQGKLDSVMPLENASMPGRVVAQWDKDDCEDLGIIKVDFLGLGMMSVLQDTVELTRQLGRPVDLAQLPQDDAKTFAMMQSADTVGVFQIESRAQMATLPRMQPKCFYDVVIEVAIIRPGPIQGHLMHPYLDRRGQVARGADPNNFSCYHEDLRQVLKRTLGVPLFQEQMLQMAMVMADFTGAEAEELRRALSFHRSQERMQKVEKKLRAAMERKKVPQNTIEDIVKAVGSFALYGFPESHAISFAHLAYASAYLKAHRAPEFYASLLNNQPMGFYSSASLVKDGQRHGIKFCPVCVAISEWDCTIEDAETLTPALSHRMGEGVEKSIAKHKVDLSGGNTVSLSPGERAGVRASVVVEPFNIRLGLRVIRGLSRSGAEHLLTERRKAPFTSLEDCKRRVRLNKEEWRILAEVGALNCFAAHRRDALWAVEKELRQGDLFESRNGGNIQHSTSNPQYRKDPHPGPLPSDGRGRSGSSGGIEFRVDDPRKVQQGAPESLALNVECSMFSSPDSASPLPPMDYAERIRADYSAMRLTTGAHPMALLRPKLKGVWRASDLPKAKHGSRIRIAGNVICRQRPGTAKGFVFISLEDETGISNAVVTPPMFEANRLVITEESFLLIEGRLQHVNNVIHVKAERIERLQCDPSVASPSYDFH
jgi:error-prone DNA polymerase